MLHGPSTYPALSTSMPALVTAEYSSLKASREAMPTLHAAVMRGPGCSRLSVSDLCSMDGSKPTQTDKEQLSAVEACGSQLGTHIL
eukprot:scaffold1621_cov350-Prasinococcus_capsulatus_cf.AAC.28